MKILIAASVPSFVDAFLIETAQECRARGWQVDLAVNTRLEGLHSTEDFDRVWHCSWQRGFEHPAGTVASAAQLRRIVRAGGYHVVHAHTPSASLAARLAVPSLRPRPGLICTAHGFGFGPGLNSWEHRVAMAVERGLLAAPDVLLLLNRDDYDWARRHRKGVTTLTHGVGVRDSFLDVAPADRVEARRRMGIGSDEFVGVTVGELRPLKRTHLAISAVAAMKGTPRRLIIVGKGSLRGDLASMAAAEMASDPSLQVTFTEFLTDVRDPMIASDVLVHTSEREGLPTALLEAMALSRPVVAVDIRGVRDLLADGGGLLTSSATDSITAALERLRTEDGLAERIAAQGRATAEQYRRSTIARETCDLYAELASRRGRPGAGGA